MRYFGLLIAFMAVPASSSGQTPDSVIVSTVAEFRVVAFGDSTPPLRTITPRRQSRFLVVDSVTLHTDSATVYMTLRDQEHVHREIYYLLSRDERWHVIRAQVDRILRLRELRGSVISHRSTRRAQESRPHVPQP